VAADTDPEGVGHGTSVRTFLIADVRGYTTYTQRFGDEAASSLAARFASLTRAVVPQFQGQVVELRGDEALCVFESARQALRAAVALQRAFRTASDEESGFPLGIGIGLDAGEAVPTDGGYRGKALNLAARLCSLAKGGESLATWTVVDLAGRVDGIGFLQRRAVSVKGVEQPVRIAAIVPDDPLPPLPAPLISAPSTRWRGRKVWAAAAFVGAALTLSAIVALHQSAERAAASAHLILRRVDLATGRRVDQDIPVPGDATRGVSLDVGSGAVWLTDSEGLVRVDPASKQSTTYRHPGSATGLVTTSDAVYSSGSTVNTPSVYRFQPGQGYTDYANISNATGGPKNGYRVAFLPLAAADGSIWVPTFAGVLQLSTALSRERLYRLPLGGHFRIAYGDHQVWVVSSSGTPIGINTLNGTTTNLPTRFPVPMSAPEIAFAQGALWVGGRGATTSTLYELNPRTGSILETSQLEGSLESLAGSPAILLADYADITRGRWVLAAKGSDGKTIRSITSRSPIVAASISGHFIWMLISRSP
jgi:class 3 adenylate cyclase/outer membrane protein assembly factor BamB